MRSRVLLRQRMKRGYASAPVGLRQVGDGFGQRLLPHVELVVAERGHVVPQLVHQLQHGTPSFGLVHIGVACPAVAGIDQDHRRRVPTLGNGRRQLRKILDLGMYIVR